MNIISFSFKSLPESELSTFANNVHLKMTQDDQFIALKPHVDELKAKYDFFTLALSNASDGGSKLILAKNKSLKELSDQLMAVAYFVNMLAKGDTEIADAAGYEVRKPAKAIDKLTKPGNLAVKQDDASGAVKLSWEKVPGAVNYGIETLKKGETAWKNGKYTTRKEIVLTGFEPGTYVEFRNRALGRNGLESEYSTVVGAWIS